MSNATTAESDRGAIVAALAAERHPACLLGEGGEILFVNAAWDRFARENGGAPACLGEHLVGKTYFNYVDGARPRAFYEGVWMRVLGGREIAVESECNSASTLRRLRTTFGPVQLGPHRAVTVLHRVLRQREVGPLAPAPADLARWAGPDGRLVACTSCRCLRRVDQQGWDFVPAVIEASAPATHVFCPDCASRLDAPGAVRILRGPP